MGSIKIKGIWYDEDSLKKKKDVNFDDLDEKAILEELETVPESVKKNRVKKEKRKTNISSGKIVIDSPSLGETKKGGK